MNTFIHALTGKLGLRKLTHQEEMEVYYKEMDKRVAILINEQKLLQEESYRVEVALEELKLQRAATERNRGMLREHSHSTYGYMYLGELHEERLLAQAVKGIIKRNHTPNKLCRFSTETYKLLKGGII